MRFRSALSFTLLCAHVLAPGLVFVPIPGTAETPSPVENVRFQDDPEQIVLTFQRIHPELAEQAVIPLIRVYGDGMVRVHHPAYMKQAGNYEMRLERNEMAELMRMITGAIVDFDSKSIHLQQQAAEQAKWNAARNWDEVTVHYISDATVTLFSVDVDSFRRANSRAEISLAAPQSASWRALAFEAQRYPGIEQLAALRAAEEKLIALTQDHRLRRHGDAP